MRQLSGTKAGGLLIATGLLSMSFSVRADDAQSENEVTVTALRTSEALRIGVLGERSLLEVPLSATGYTSSLILDQAARTTSEVLANDPSIRVQSAGDGNYDYFTTRGFSV